MYFQQKRMKYYFSRYKNRKYLGGCYFSIRYTGLKHNALMEAMKLLKGILVGNWITWPTSLTVIWTFTNIIALIQYLYDEYYFVRGKSDLRLCTDSAQFDKDPNFSTGYDYKVAKIIANEMLRIYLNKRLVKLETNTQVEDNLQKCLKYPFRFTGKKVFLIELGYSLVSSGDINNGNVEIKEMMNFLGTVFQVELGDYYAAYIAMKERKKDRTAYLSRLQESLVKRMDEDDSKWQVSIFLFASVILFSFNPTCHIEILLSINPAINISIKTRLQDCKINSSVGGTPSGKGAGPPVPTSEKSFS